MENYLFFQNLIDGLSLGFVYAMVALGYTMVYGVLRLINFAHGEIFMVGAFCGTGSLLLLKNLGFFESMPIIIVIVIAILIASLVSGLVGLIAEFVAYRPLRKAPRLVLFISTIGVSFFLQDIVRLIVSLKNNAFYMVAPSTFNYSFNITKNIRVPGKTILLISVSILIMIFLELFVTRSKWGIAMRAVAQDKYTAALMGINVNTVISLTFFIGAALGGAAGTLFAIQYSLIHPYIGFILGMKAFTAAVLGGIGNIPGAMLGGLLIGVLESFGGMYLGILTNGAFGAEYKDVFAFAILILVLVFKPNGILGKEVKEKI